MVRVGAALAIFAPQYGARPGQSEPIMPLLL